MGKVEGRERYLASLNVFPNVEFGPVGKGEDPEVLALVMEAVENAPQLWPLVLRVPLTVPVTVAEEAFLCPSLLFISSSTTKGSVCLQVENGIQ